MPESPRPGRLRLQAVGTEPLTNTQARAMQLKCMYVSARQNRSAGLQCITDLRTNDLEQRTEVLHRKKSIPEALHGTFFFFIAIP